MTILLKEVGLVTGGHELQTEVVRIVRLNYENMYIVPPAFSINQIEVYPRKIKELLKFEQSECQDFLFLFSVN